MRKFPAPETALPSGAICDTQGYSEELSTMKKEFMVERQGRAFCLYAGLLDLAHQHGLKSIRTELVQIPSEANNRIAISTATVTLEKDGVERTFTGIGDAAPNNVAPAMQTALIRMAETRAKARALRDAVNIGVTAFEELGDDDAQDGAPERGYSMSPTRTTRPEKVERVERNDRNGANSRPMSSNQIGASSAEPNGSRHANGAASAQNGNGNDVGARTPAAESAVETMPIPADLRNPAANLITEQQLEAIRNLCKRREVDVEAMVAEKFAGAKLAALTQAQGMDLIKSLNERNARPAAA